MRRSIVLSSTFVLVSGASVFGCAEELDQTREARPKSTLGEDIYSVLCDRVGASSLSEDLEGQSYRSICHKTDKGFTGTKVKRALLPSVASLPTGGAEGQSGGACRATDKPCDGTLQCVRSVCAPGSYARRELGIAKLEALARHRDELIQAFDATFPEAQIDDPFSPGKKVRLIDAVDLLTKRLTALYEAKDPKDPLSALVPASTDALARLFDGIASDPAAQAALSRMGNRQGYKPLPVALGTMRPMFLYPRFRELSKLLISRFGPGGSIEPQFQEMLGVLREELRTLVADPKEPPLTVDAAKAQPSRPRQKIEFVSALLLDEKDAYSRLGLVPKWMAARDRRGFALPAGVTPGSVPAPFVADAEGLPKVDAAGRYVGDDGAPLAIAPPFASPGFVFDPKYTFDASGRAVDGSKLLYQYRDATRTMVGSLMFDLRPLIAPRSGLDVGDASTLMKALEGAFVLYGPEKQGKRSYPLPSGKDVELGFTGFDADRSPFVDLTHATGAFFGAPGSDDYLGSTLTLHEKRPEITGETLALAWRIWFESKKPEYAAARLDDASTLWDELGLWVAKVARVDKAHYIAGAVNPNPRGLLADVTLAMADPAAVEWLPKAYAPTMRNRDRLTYDTNNVNGAPFNQDTKQVIGADAWKTPVDRGAPDTGYNRSGLQRFLGVISAASKVKACNKPGTKVVSRLTIDCPVLPAIGVPLSYPLLPNDTIDECALFEIPDIGVFFVDSILDWSHPRRARLVVKDGTLTGLLKAVDGIIPDACGKLDIDTVLEVSTGITGLRTTPTPQALTRLLFFGAASKTFGDKLPDIDPNLTGKNKSLNDFISNSMEPVATSKCPKNPNGVHTCVKFEDTLRGIGQSTFFASETPWLAKHPAGCKGGDCDKPSSGFYEGMRPILTAFANYTYAPDAGEACLKDAKGQCAGEQLFLDLLTILEKHWSSTTTTKLVKYEDFLAWVFADSGMLSTSAKLVAAMRDTPYTSARVRPGQPRDGLDVTTDLIGFMFDEQISKSLGTVDRKGSSTTTWNDGKTPKQVTPYDLFVKALRGMDARMDSLGDSGAKKAVWRSARSELVDQFLLAEGTSWKNPAISEALPTLGRLVREQINVRCPTRESWYATGTKPKCDWADKTFTESFARTIDGPLFGTINRLQEALRADDEARVELQLLLDFLMQQEMSPDAVSTTLTALADLLQVFHDDEDLAPIMNAVSIAATPGQVGGAKTAQPGIAHATVVLLKTLLDDSGGPAKTVDRYHVLDHILRNLVTPMGEGRRSPLEVLIDTTTDVHRYDSATDANLSGDDWLKVSNGVESFLADDYRGMHQFYKIVRDRRGE